MTLSSTERGLNEALLLPAPWRQLALGREIAFCLGPDTAPADAMERAAAFTRRTLPMLLGDTLVDHPTREAAISVVRELVDITARNRHGSDIVGRILADDAHITVTVGEARGQLPAPHDEPGLYLVRRLADDIGQYQGDEGGYVTWASIPALPKGP
ncbi:hypothetical protein ACWD4V_01295 [Streptomyces tsukubensis]